MKSIETGVDKLLTLVNTEKKIEISDAAKALGVSKQVIQEWADFLEDEKLLTIEFSLSRVYLLERKLSKNEIEKKTKEYSSKKEAFTRKVDTTLKKLEQNTAGFEDIKTQYYELKKEIGDEISQVKDEVNELRHYEELKDNIDSDIIKQKVDYEKTLGDIHRRITSEEKRYSEIHDEIEKETESIESERKAMGDLEHQEDALAHRLDALKEVVQSITKQLSGEQESIEHHEARLETLKKLAESLEKNIRQKKEKEITPLIATSDKHQKKILDIQSKIIDKIKDRKKEIAEHETQGIEIAERFEKFFDKKLETERIVLDLEKQKEEMRTELQELISKAKLFDLTSKSANTQKHIRELEKQFSDLESKQTHFTKRLGTLKDIISGKHDVSEKKTVKKPAKKSVKKTSTKKKPAKKKSVKKVSKKKSAKKKK